MAFAVPTTCEAVPNATPLAVLLLILKILKILGPIILPKVPVAITKANVIEGFPLICLDISTAIAAVVDLGTKDKIIISSSKNTLLNIITDNIPARDPINIPIKIGNRFFFKTSIFLYIGIERTIVAGPKKNPIIFPPFS